MDNLVLDEEALNANLGATDLSYDNDALEVLTELFDGDTALPDELLLHSSGVRPSPQMQHRRTEHLVPGATHTLNLPDSPPYSGSEPYSPDSHKILSPSAASETSSSSGYHTGPSPQPSELRPQESYQQDGNYLMFQQQMAPQQRLQKQMGGLQDLPLAQLVANENHVRTALHPQVYCPEDGQYNQPTKKRKYREGPDGVAQVHNPMERENQMPVPQQVKQEPGVMNCGYDNVVESSPMDLTPSILTGGSYQPIKWHPFQPSACARAIDSNGRPVKIQTYRLDGDKGFNFSATDKAFVCQKKNHFQITGCLELSDSPMCLVVGQEIRPIDGLYMHFYGVKEEAPNQVIQIDQSQADRSKKKFSPIQLHPNMEHCWKVTVGRLHFSDTTLNNMRKRGKPNPDQRYFLLVVGIVAHCQGKEYPIAQQCSEKLIVRASNPGQFQDQEAEPVKWQPGQTPNSVYHNGKVGINTDTPDEALTVAGNVKVMGHIVQPSDKRVKEDITEVDTKENLMNMKAINLYNYRYTEEFAEAAGLDDPEHVETGVIAQEVEIIIPEAVKTTADVQLPDGEVIENLKVVNKDRLFMESLGAVKELCNVTDTLESKINYLERFNKKLAKLKRMGSIKSTVSSTDSDLSRLASVSTISRVTVTRKRKPQRVEDKMATRAKGVCSNRFLQILIMVLVFVMVACIGVILGMLVLEKTASVSQNTAANPQQDGGVASVFTTEILKGRTTLPNIPDSARRGPTETFPSAFTSCGQSDGVSLLKSHCFGETGCYTNTCPGVGDCVFPQAVATIEPLLGPTAKIEADSDQMETLQIYLGSSYPPDQEKMSYKPMKGQRFPAYPKRRKRSSRILGTSGLVDSPLTDISLTLRVSDGLSDLTYPIGQENCLDCDKTCDSAQDTSCYNFTFVVQLHETFGQTTGTLSIERETSRPTSVMHCMADSPLESLRCRDPEHTTGETGLPPISVTSIDNQPMELNIAVGAYSRSTTTFRVFNTQNADNQPVCHQPTKRDMVAINLVFMRVCGDCPATKSDLRNKLGFANP